MSRRALSELESGVLRVGSIRGLARELGVVPTTLRYHLRKRGSSLRAGRQGPPEKFTTVQMINALNGSDSVKAAARKLGVDESSVRQRLRKERLRVVVRLAVYGADGEVA